MLEVTRDRVWRDLFSLSVLWVGCFFLSLLLTSPLRFFALGWNLLTHGILWRPFNWQEVLLHRNVYLATVLAVPHLLINYIRVRDADEFFTTCVLVEAPTSQLPEMPRRPVPDTLWNWIRGSVQQLSWGVLVWVTSFIPVVGTVTAVAVKFWVFRSSLNTLWAVVLSGLAFLAPFDSSFLVFFFVTSSALGQQLLQPHVYDRYPEQRSVMRHNVHAAVILGFVASLVMSVPLLGGPLLWAMYALGAHIYVTLLLPQFEKM
jgi:hypothetical protein